MPDPNKYESQEEWMKVCVPKVMGEGKDNDAAVGQCMGMWNSRGKSVTEVIYYGDAIKAEQTPNGVKLGGYLVRFGDAQNTDLTGDYFTPNTDFGPMSESTTWFNHRQPIKLKKHDVQVKYTEPLPNAMLKRDDVGIFAEVVIEARNEYEQTIAELGLAGKLAWSSGTATHLVDRKNIKNNVFEITRWPLGLDASLTPTPAEFRHTNQVLPIKSLIPSEAALSDKGDIKNNQLSQEKKIMEEDNIKSAVEKAVAEVLAAQEAKREAEALKAAELKAAEEKGYAAALEEVRGIKVPAFNTKTVLGFSEEKDAVPAFKHWIKTGQVNGGLISPDSSFNAIPEAKSNATAWNATTGASGAFLVPDPLYNQIIAKRDIASWVRQAGVQPFVTPADHLLVPYENASQGNFVKTTEAAAYDEDAATVGQVDLILYKYTKLNKVSEEFLTYNTTNFDSWLVDCLGRAEAATENTIYTTGTGSGSPLGIDAATGSTVANTLATADTILPAELTAFLGYLGAGYNVPSECAFVMANVTKWYLRGIAASAGGLVYQSTPDGMISNNQLFGYPIIINDDVSPYTTNASKIIFFGNWKYYGIVEKPGMTVQRNPYLYMATGQVGLFASIFRGGSTLQREAIIYLTNQT